MKYKIWNGTDTLITPVGEVLSAEQVKSKYPASALDGMKYIICDSPISLGVFMEFTQTKESYKKMGANIVDGMTDQEVLDAITAFEDTPPPAPSQEPTPEERIAASLEFQSMMLL
jgi:hypothetical protein